MSQIGLRDRASSPAVHSVPRRAQLTAGAGVIVPPLVTLVVVVGAWELLARTQGNFAFASFTDTVKEFFPLILDGSEVWRALWITNQALIVGYGAAVVIGVPLGLAIGRSRRIAAIANPYLDILLTTPIAPLMPLAVMALGLTLESRALVVMLFAFVVIVVNVRAGVREVDRSLIDMARSFGATERTVWRRILLPASAPTIVTGLRLGLSRAVDGMVVVELLLVSVGIGGLVVEYRTGFEPAKLFATVWVVCIEAVVLLGLMRLLERRARRGR